MNIQLLTTHC